MSERVTVVGIGADGWPGLTETGRAELARADVIVGGPRHLAMLPEDLKATRESLPIPLVEGLPQLLEEYAGHPVHVVASGDPMHYGIGSTLVRLLGPEMVRVVPHPGSVSLACARLGWSVEDVDVISTVGRPLYRVREVLSPGGRVLVLSEGAMTPAAVCALLVGAGFGPSEVIVLEQLGGSPRPRPRRPPRPAGSTRSTSSRSRCWPNPAAAPCPGPRACPTTRSRTTGRSPSGRSGHWRWLGSRPDPANCSGMSAAGRAASASSGCGLPGARSRSPSSVARTAPNGSP
jgi:precorrin-6y C5,15-methyltransferase (decarboxylating) CbiE subunit